MGEWYAMRMIFEGAEKCGTLNTNTISILIFSFVDADWTGSAREGGR